MERGATRRGAARLERFEQGNDAQGRASDGRVELRGDHQARLPLEQLNCGATHTHTQRVSHGAPPDPTLFPTLAESLEARGCIRSAGAPARTSDAD